MVIPVNNKKYTLENVLKRLLKDVAVVIIIRRRSNKHILKHTLKVDSVYKGTAYINTQRLKNRAYLYRPKLYIFIYRDTTTWY